MTEMYYHETRNEKQYKLQITIKNLKTIYLRKPYLEEFEKIIHMFDSIDRQFTIESDQDDIKFCLVAKNDVITSQVLLDILQKIKGFCSKENDSSK